VVDDSVVLAAQALDHVFLGLIALLGVALLFLRPRTRSSLALAAFLVCYGVFLILNVLPPGRSDVLLVANYAGDVLTLLAAVALVVLCLNFPRPPSARERRALAAPFGFAVLAGVVSGAVAASYTLAGGVTNRGWDPPWLNAIAEANFTFCFSIYCGATMAFAVRFRQLALAGDARSARAAAHVAMAFGPIAMLITVLSASYAAEARGADLLFEAVYASLALGLVGFWAWATWRVAPPLSAAGRNVALLLAALGIVTLAVEAIDLLLYQVLVPVARFTCLAVLSYAIVRQQLFDLDMRLKVTLSRSTMAAVFLAVFFVVAQLAQNFLSATYGWSMGGIAAGLLLFAITPIQRAAERLSDKALPSVQPGDPAYVLRKKRDAYRHVYAAAWSDGRMTAKEARLLTEFKVALGMPDGEYAAIEREWSAASLRSAGTSGG
jgi:hypothetical protein